ncbi:MAG: hypothetical protein LUH19_05135 [Lachnospiraceae bacterium]|nr:hypothetical protein [Lachnospiraceae bacterium]
MKRRDYWSAETNPETGKKFEQFLDYINLAHNGYMDVDKFIDSEYGEAFAQRLQIRFLYEDDAMGEECLAYYRSIGLKKEMYHEDDYYSRWVVFTPLEAESHPDRKYPLIISQHGGGSSIETEEFSCGYPEIAAREGFMLLMLQNTNWDCVKETLELVKEKYPVDCERIYMSGLSQGGSQTNTALQRMPELLTAVAPNSCDFYRTTDNFDVQFTEEEKSRVKKAVVPFIQTVGACDASYYVPLNFWQPRKSWDGKIGNPETFHHPQFDNEKDPTWIHDPEKGFRDAARLKMKKEPHWWMPHPSSPAPGVDVHRWAVARLNNRLESLGCAVRDVDQCIAYEKQPEDEYHHLLGFYADKEEVREIFGCKHYFADCFNEEGVNTFRFVVVDNFPHWQSLMMAELCWDFFRQFKRDQSTGKLVCENYKKSEQ